MIRAAVNALVAFVIVIIMGLGFLIGFSLAEEHHRRRHEIVVPHDAGIRQAEVDVLKWIKRMFGVGKRRSGPAAPPASPQVPRTKGRVTYTIIVPDSVLLETSFSPSERSVIMTLGQERTAQEIETLSGLKKKSVESTLWRLRHRGIVRSSTYRMGRG